MSGNFPGSPRTLRGGLVVIDPDTSKVLRIITFQYNPAAAVQVSGITQDFRGANNYRPNVTCDPVLPSGDRTITHFFNTDCVVLPTGNNPFGNAGGAIYLTNGQRDYAIVLSPLGAVRVHAFEEGTNQWTN